MPKPKYPAEIDYSEAYSALAELQMAELNWEAPPHVFYGKRMPNGKSEKEPVYVYQEYPRMLYKPIEGKIRAKVVNDDKTKQAMLDAGWGLTPADFGVETLPARDRVTSLNYVDAASITEEAPIKRFVPVKKKGGRPKRVAPPAVAAAPVTE